MKICMKCSRNMKDEDKYCLRCGTEYIDNQIIRQKSTWLTILIALTIIIVVVCYLHNLSFI